MLPTYLCTDSTRVAGDEGGGLLNLPGCAQSLIRAVSPERALAIYATRLRNDPELTPPPRPITMTVLGLGPRRLLLQEDVDLNAPPPGRYTCQHGLRGRKHTLRAACAQDALDTHAHHLAHHPEKTRQGEPGVSTLVGVRVSEHGEVVASGIVDYAPPGADVLAGMLRTAIEDAVIDWSHEAGGFEIAAPNWTGDTGAFEIESHITNTHDLFREHQESFVWEAVRECAAYWTGCTEALREAKLEAGHALALWSDPATKLPSCEPGRDAYDSARIGAVRAHLTAASDILLERCEAIPPAYDFLLGWAEDTLDDREIINARAELGVSDLRARGVESPGYGG